MYFYGYFLINFFIPPRRAEAIAWENFVPAKRDPRCTLGGDYMILVGQDEILSCLARIPAVL